jgi:hypothetical protein
LYAAFPRPKAAFASSRRAASASNEAAPGGAAIARPPLANVTTNVNAASAPSAAAPPVIHGLRIAFTITRARAFMEYPLALFVDGSVPFSRQSQRRSRAIGR